MHDTFELKLKVTVELRAEYRVELIVSLKQYVSKSDGIHSIKLSSEWHMEFSRPYQLNRVNYYYLISLIHCICYLSYVKKKLPQSLMI